MLSIVSGQQPQLFMQGVFLGSENELRYLLQPLLMSSPPKEVTIQEMPWLEAAARIGATQPDTPESFKSVGPFIEQLLPDKAVDTISYFIGEAPPSITASVLFHGLGGAVAEIGNTETAYFYRKALSNMSPWATWDAADGAAQGIRWVEDFRKAMLPYTCGVYVNTPDLLIENWPQGYYGCNFHRLTRIKAKYDPMNIFHYPQSIPPEFCD